MAISLALRRVGSVYARDQRHDDASTVNPYQPKSLPTRPPTRRCTYLTLFAWSVAFLGIAGAIAWYAIATYQSDMADGVDNGDAEAAGFYFMFSLMPAAIGLILFVSGLLAFARRKAGGRTAPGPR